VCRYFLVGPTAQQTRSFDWLRDHLPTDGSVQLSDVTSMYTALDVIGPKAKELLSELTDTPLSKQDFMHMTCKVGISDGDKTKTISISQDQDLCQILMLKMHQSRFLLGLRPRPCWGTLQRSPRPPSSI